MNTVSAFATAICVILAGATIPPCVLGQIAPCADSATTGKEEAPLPSISETAADPSQGAGCSDLDFGQQVCSRWTASAEFMILERVGSTPYVLVETVPSRVRYDDLSKTPGTPVLNADDFRPGFSGGPRVGLIRQGDDGRDLEVSYFQIDGWQSDRAVGPTPDDWLVMRAPGNFLQTQNDYPTLQQVMGWEYTSRLYNAEVNMRWHPCRRVTVLTGFRWVNVTEELVGILTPPTAHGTGPFWDTRTKNNLYGLQIGADAKLLERNRFSIDGVLKTGIFDNHASEATSVRIDRIQFPESDSTDCLAFLGEVGVQCHYQVNRRLSLKAGYEAVWLQGLALAPGQIVETYSHGSVIPREVSVQSLGVNCSSGVFYHGATTGLEYSF